jgi:hypothetical protein
MKQKTNKRLIVGLIILVTVVNLASLGAIVYLRYYADGLGDFKKPERFERPDRYDPNKETRLLFEEARQKFKAKIHPHARELRANQSMIMEELMKENPDKALLDSLAQRSGRLHATIRQNMTDVFIEMNRKADPEQQRHLRRFYRHFMMDDRPHHHRERQYRNRKGKKPDGSPQGF